MNLLSTTNSLDQEDQDACNGLYLLGCLGCDHTLVNNPETEYNWTFVCVCIPYKVSGGTQYQVY